MSPIPKSCPDSPERLSIDRRKKRRRKRTAAFDIITGANEAAERKISAPLLKAFAAVIVREEAAGRDPKMPDHYRSFGVYCRPHRGNQNFSAGIALLGVIVSATIQPRIDPCGYCMTCVPGHALGRQVSRALQIRTKISARKGTLNPPWPCGLRILSPVNPMD